ncbi:MAG: hypothetical protein M1826_003793 [Phylliscum demangeonii]|nr:MAG: hypothetical protein M1826_003793 [Phylliscum demangeonii]
MARTKRELQRVAQEISGAPDALEAGQVIGRVLKAEGNNLYSVECAGGSGKAILLVELAARFRSTIWIRRRGFVLIDRAAFGDRPNKLEGEIINIVQDERAWRKRPYWPKQFPKDSVHQDQEEDGSEEDVVGALPAAEEDD